MKESARNPLEDIFLPASYRGGIEPSRGSLRLDRFRAEPRLGLLQIKD
jgi:hypothetical protein